MSVLEEALRKLFADPPGDAAPRSGSDDPPRTNLQLVGLLAAVSGANVAAQPERAPADDQVAATPEFVTATFRFDTAHSAPVPAAHQPPTPNPATEQSPQPATGDTPLSTAGDTPPLAAGDTPPLAAGDTAPLTPPLAAGDTPLSTPGDTPLSTPGDTPLSAPGDTFLSTPGGTLQAGGRGASGVAAVAGGEFRPAYEVDRFRWPAVCQSLREAIGAELESAAARVLDEIQGGQNVVAVAGLAPQSGSTTFLLCLARELAAEGLRVLLVDAHAAHPALAPSLGIQAPCGWNQPASAAVDVAETVVTSLEDGIALASWADEAPGRHPQADLAGNWRRLIAVVRGHVDLVLVDAGSLEPPSERSGFTVFTAGGVDRVILLQSEARMPTASSARCIRELLAAGVTPMGIVRNAHPAGGGVAG